MEMPFSLMDMGWNSFFESQLSKDDSQNFTIARVAVEYKNHYLVYSGNAELEAEPSGKLLYSASARSELPKVGDWVLITPYDSGKAVIQLVLKRKTCLSRKVAGNAHQEQVIAANLDLLFIVQSLDDDFSINRLERYLAIVEGDIKPVIILNKADLCTDIETKTAEVKSRLPHVRLLTMCALSGSIADIEAYFTNNETAGFVGSSGAGKTTLINRLAGIELRTGEVRSSDSKGRHTTTNRQLVRLPGGGILIDTPGMRELQLWTSGSLTESAFPEIEELARHCRFRDCKHTGDDGCAILQAIDQKQLRPEQYRNYIKIRREQDYARTLTDRQFEQSRKKEIKKVHRWINQMKRNQRPPE